MILAALSLLGLARAEAPLPMEAPRLPGGFELPAVQGELDLHPQSSATEGVANIRHDKLFQTIGWEPIQGSLLDAVTHERGLVYLALEQPVPADAPAPTEVEVAGTTGLHWEVDGEPTLFVGTSFHCPGLRVELTSFGADAALVRQVHAASLAGATCPPPGGLGMSGG
jgi:hypothetical protein